MLKPILCDIGKFYKLFIHIKVRAYYSSLYCCMLRNRNQLLFVVYVRALPWTQQVTEQYTVSKYCLLYLYFLLLMGVFSRAMLEFEVNCSHSNISTRWDTERRKQTRICTCGCCRLRYVYI